MGLKTITGKKVPVDYTLDRQLGVKDPQVILYNGGKVQTSIRCANLIAVTGVTDPTVIQQVTAYAAGIPEDAPWTKEQVADLCRQIGKLPFPRYVQVEHLEGQATLLVKVVNHKGAGVTELSYPKDSNRPSLNVGPALKDENIRIPEGMWLEIPVTLVLDEGVLKVEFCLRKGVERPVSKRTGDSGVAGQENDEEENREAEQ